MCARRVSPTVAADRSVDRQAVMGVGVVDARRRDVVELLARAGRGLRDVDDLQDLGTAETGDLHGTHTAEARAGAVVAAAGTRARTHHGPPGGAHVDTGEPRNARS